MTDMFLPTLHKDAIYSDALRIEPVIGDGMSPRLRSGFDFVLVKPTNTYLGEGTYIWFDGLGSSLINVQFTGGKKVRLFYENAVYTEILMDKEEFEECVLALVVADIKVRDCRFLTRATRP